MRIDSHRKRWGFPERIFGNCRTCCAVMQSKCTPRVNAESIFIHSITQSLPHLLRRYHSAHPFFPNLHRPPRPPLSPSFCNNPMTCRLHRDRNHILTQISVRAIRHRRQIRHADRKFLPAAIAISIGVQRHSGAAVNAHALRFIAPVGHVLPAQPDAPAVAIVVRLCAHAGNGRWGGCGDEDDEGHEVLHVIGEARGGRGLVGGVGFGSGEDGHNGPRVAILVGYFHSRTCRKGEGCRVVGFEAEGAQLSGVGAVGEAGRGNVGIGDRETSRVAGVEGGEEGGGSWRRGVALPAFAVGGKVTGRGASRKRGGASIRRVEDGRESAGIIRAGSVGGTSTTPRSLGNFVWRCGIGRIITVGPVVDTTGNDDGQSLKRDAVIRNGDEIICVIDDLTVTARSRDDSIIDLAGSLIDIGQYDIVPLQCHGWVIAESVVCRSPRIGAPSVWCNMRITVVATSDDSRTACVLVAVKRCGRAQGVCDVGY